MLPSVTLFLCNYNDSKYIAGAIERALEQTRLPDEIVVVDDGSTDDSVEIVRHLAEESNGLVTLRQNEINIGVVPSIIRHLPSIDSDYIWFHAADDVFLPNFLEKQYEMILSYPQAGLVFSNLGFFVESPDRIERTSGGWGDEARYFTPHECEQAGLSTNINAHCIVHRERLIASHCLNPRLRWYVDTIWNYALAFKHGVCYVPETLSLMCVRSDSYSARRLENKVILHDTYSCIMDLLHNELSDIAHHFVMSQIMDQFDRALVDFVLSTPKYRDPLSMALIHPLLHQQTMEFVHRKQARLSHEKNSLELLEKELPFIADWVATICAKRGKKRIAIYGAGKQTELLLEHWECFSSIEIVCILTSHPTYKSSVYSIPVFEASKVSSSAFDLILLSSLSYELEMKEAVKKNFPDVLCLSVWNDIHNYKSAERQLLSERFPRLIEIIKPLGIKYIVIVGMTHLETACKQLLLGHEAPSLLSHQTVFPEESLEVEYGVVVLDSKIENPEGFLAPIFRLDLI